MLTTVVSLLCLFNNATYNGGTNKIATFNTTSLSLNPQNSAAFLLGTDGSLRLQHVYDDTTSNSANMYIHSDGNTPSYAFNII